MKSRYIGIIYTARARLLLILLLGMLVEKTAAQVSTTIDPGITIEVTGDITVRSDGNWLNQGMMLPGNSRLTLKGPYTQFLQQEGGAFHDLKIKKDTGEVILSGNIHVDGGLLKIVSQDLNLNGHIITLDTQAKMNETDGNTVNGATGYITTTRLLSAPSGNNIAGMGVVLTSTQNLGTTEIRRGHTAQTANGEQSILRYFDVMPQFNADLNATVKFIYDETELNGQDETALKMYRSSDGGVNWEKVPGSLNVEGNFFKANGLNTLSRFTLSSHNMETYLPIVCQEATLNLGALSSLTINPLDLLVGSSGTYAGYTFIVEPAILQCDQLGFNEVTITGTDPVGEISVCQTTIFLNGPDADCDGVSDACDVCDGGDDKLDTDGDGIPNCSDWDGWANLLPEWQCGNNKVYVCHNNHVICINQNAVPAHLGHGDILGPCDAVSCPTSFAQPEPDVDLMESNDVNEHLSFNNSGNSEVDLAEKGMLVLENHPNPFYKETWIRAYIPASNEIVLSVFDMMGKPLIIMANDYYEKGWHEFRFDGSDYPPGVYYYRLESNGQRITRSMVLMNN